MRGRISDFQYSMNLRCHFCNRITWKNCDLGGSYKVPTSSFWHLLYVSFCPYRSFRSHHQTHSVQLMCLSTQPLPLSRRYHWVNQKPNNSTTSQNGKELQKVTEPFPVLQLPSAPPASTPRSCGSTGTRAGCYQGACEQDGLKWSHAYQSFNTFHYCLTPACMICAACQHVF